MMKVDVISDAADITDLKIEGRVAVVIDVLRATSVMCTALENGAKFIVPVTSIDECNEWQKKLTKAYPSVKVLRGGERNTYRIGDFELDNSPLSYCKQIVKDSIVVMTTTNGTRTINRCRRASEIIIGSLLNAESVTDYILQSGQDVVLVCSGRKDRYTMEDGYCAGYITSLLCNYNPDCKLSDFAWEQKNFYERFRNNPLEAFVHCEHYNNIKDRLSADVDFCLRKNIYGTIPKIYNNEDGGYQEIR